MTIALAVIICVLAMVIIILRNRIQKIQKRLETATTGLKKAETKALHANKMKDLFIKNMSQEIRTPINAVMGFSQLLTHPDLKLSKDERQEYCQHILDNANLVIMLIDDILNVSDLETGSYRIDLRHTMIKRLCESTLSIMRHMIPAGVQLRFVNELPEDFECVIDSQRAEQVLVNFITNSCKRTVEGFIELRTELNTKLGYVKFSVTDTGKRFNADELRDMFKKITQIDNISQGIGLGMYTCATIAKKMNGHVWVDNKYTEGTRYCFDIPINLKPKK